jgi:hypothetical protein
MRGPPIVRKENGRAPNYLLLLAGVLGAALAVLFYKSFQPHQVLFANDGPLGAMLAECNRLPGRFFGTWRNISWIGSEAPSAAPSLSAILMTIFPPALFLKIYAPATLFFVGFSAWVFFRQLEFNPAVCVLGGIAAGLNMHFLSTACWGLGAWNMSAGMIFLALAALSSKSIKPIWAKAVLAGLAVGLNLIEGFDVGAIMSIYVGIFVLFRAFSQESGLAGKTLRGILTEVLVVCFAGLIAAHTISSLVGTQIEGVTGTQQDTETKERRWDFATQWSLPKLETLRLVTPGVFGYLLAQNMTEQDKSAGYWGLVGQDPRIVALKSEDPQVRAKVVAQISQISPLWPKEQTGMDSSDRHTREAAAADIIQRLGFIARHTGTGEYAGVLVALLAVFALANSCRGPNTPFSPTERRAVWFWAGAALFSILAAWGRHGFLYSFLYRLPYFSTIRNPIKFLHPFHVIWLILAGYGLEVLHRRYLRNTVRRTAFLPEHIKSWWSRAAGFEKKWVAACALVLAACLAGWAVLFSSELRLAQYLVDHGFKMPVATHMAESCVREAAWFIGFLVLAAGAVAGILSGAWTGSRAKMAWIYLGAILILDLGRTGLPWIHYFDYQKKYSPNAVVDFLSEKKPWEQRVMGRLSPRRAGSSNNDPNGRSFFGPLYNFWMQNDFPYHEIQCLDFAEMPRMPEMDDAYMHDFELQGTNILTADLRPAARLWELTGTRYLLLDAGGLGLLNEHGDPVHHSFHQVFTFRMEPKEPGHVLEDIGDYTVYRDPRGPIALIEYTNVLPRVKLFAHWQTPADGAATLATLVSPDFISAQTVLLWPTNTVAQAPGDPMADAGAVEITDYHPKDIKLHAVAKMPAVLLLNERIHPNWSVTVDQQPAPMLRCNYIMRGVFLKPGEHTVEFHYHAPLKTLYLSLGGWAAGLFVAGYVALSRRSQKAP